MKWFRQLSLIVLAAGFAKIFAVLVESTSPTVASDNALLCPGRAPTWDDLQTGRLIQRPVFQALQQAFAQWRLQGKNWSANAPMVFCIRDRSGDGKSALLLQLAGAPQQEEITLTLNEAADDPCRFISLSKPVVNNFSEFFLTLSIAIAKVKAKSTSNRLLQLAVCWQGEQFVGEAYSW